MLCSASFGNVCTVLPCNRIRCIVCYPYLHLIRLLSCCLQLLPSELSSAAVELLPYLLDSFGNPTRIDYGTGHETTFVAFLYCLAALGLVKESDRQALVCVVFNRWVMLQWIMPCWCQCKHALADSGEGCLAGIGGVWCVHWCAWVHGKESGTQLVTHAMRPALWCQCICTCMYGVFAGRMPALCVVSLYDMLDAAAGMLSVLCVYRQAVLGCNASKQRCWLYSSDTCWQALCSARLCDGCNSSSIPVFACIAACACC